MAETNLCPVHTYPEIFVSANFFMRIHLASTRVRRIRSPEWKFLYTLCIRIRVDACIRIFLYTLTSQYQNQSFSAREIPSKQTRKPRIWRQNYCRLSFLCNAHALLTNPLRCPDTNRIRVDGRIRFVYAMCGRRYFCIRIKKFADTKISGYVWTGHWFQSKHSDRNRGIKYTYFKLKHSLCVFLRV